jgi:hypothetical protein
MAVGDPSIPRLFPAIFSQAFTRDCVGVGPRRARGKEACPSKFIRLLTIKV